MSRRQSIREKIMSRVRVDPDPDHLEMVTRKQNAMRREQARRIRCEEALGADSAGEVGA